MDSLNGLAGSLPAHNSGENDLLKNFKAAALSVTSLYRFAQQDSNRSYNDGYAAACQDMLSVIQQGVSDSSVASGSEPGINIGKVMDWIEARLDAVKNREDEDSEDEERDRDRDRDRDRVRHPKSVTTSPKKAEKKADNPTTSTLKRKEKTTAPSVSPRSPLAPLRLSPTPPPNLARPHRSLKRRSERDHSQSYVAPSEMSSLPYPAPSSLSFPSSGPAEDLGVSIGVKRRHAMMMMLDSQTSPSILDLNVSVAAENIGPSGSGRRKTRSLRILPNFSAPTLISDAMDVEDDGRERKRMSRRP